MDLNIAKHLLEKSAFHILVTGKTGAGKSTLLREANIPDSKYYDFTVDLAEFNYDFLNGRPGDWEHHCALSDELADQIDFYGEDAHTLILDAVEFPHDLSNSKLISLLKTARKHGKRLIMVAYPDNAEPVINTYLFGAVIHLEKNGDDFTCDPTVMFDPELPEDDE